MARLPIDTPLAADEHEELIRSCGPQASTVLAMYWAFPQGDSRRHGVRRLGLRVARIEKLLGEALELLPERPCSNHGSGLSRCGDCAECRVYQFRNHAEEVRSKP